MVKKYARGFSIAGAVCFILMAVIALYNFVMHFNVYNSISSLGSMITFIFILGTMITAVGLIAGEKNILIVLGTATLSISSIYNITQYLTIAMYASDIYYVCFILSEVSVILIFIISLFTYISKLTDISRIVKKLWFIPVILIFICSSVIIIRNTLSLLDLHNLYIIISSFAYFCLSLWVTSELYENSNPKINDNNFSNAYFNLAGHIILTVFVFIWQYYWVYRTTANLNYDKSSEYRNPTKKLLLYAFVPFYSYYWVYTSCKRIDNIAKQRGITSDITTLCVVFSIFIPFVSTVIMQNRINEICNKPVFSVTINNENTASNFNTKSNTELLREYKSLLDDGVITQEDFEKKKNEII